MFSENALNKTRRIARWIGVGLQVVGLLAAILGSAVYLVVYLLLVTRTRLLFYKLGFRLVLLTRRLPRKLRRELVDIYDREIEEYIVSIRVRDFTRILRYIKLATK